MGIDDDRYFDPRRTIPRFAPSCLLPRLSIIYVRSGVTGWGRRGTGIFPLEGIMGRMARPRSWLQPQATVHCRRGGSTKVTFPVPSARGTFVQGSSICMNMYPEGQATAPGLHAN